MNGDSVAKRISIINFKGGVGKTTLALNLAGYLSRNCKKKVLLVDVDHQSSLSLVILKPDVWKKLDEDGKTINAVFEHFTDNQKPMPGKELIVKEPYADNNGYNQYPGLDLVPAALRLDETELDLTSTSMGNPIESEWKKRTLICEWIEKNGLNEEYDYIIFDCPPATKIVTQNAIAASQGYIIPVIPDAVSTRGIPHLVANVFTKIDKKFSYLAEFLKTKEKKITTIYVPDTKFLGIVISKIKTSGPAYSGYTNDQTINLKTLENVYAQQKQIIKPYIEEGVGVPEALGMGSPVYTAYIPNIINRGFIGTFEKVSEEIKKRMDSL